MSRLDELIEELCPDGVKYYQLSEIAHYSSERMKLSEATLENYVGVENLLQNKQGKILATSLPPNGNVIRYHSGDVLIGNIRPYLRKIWLANQDGGTNGDVLTIQIDDRNIVTPEFLYYILSSEQFFIYDNQNAKGSKMPRGDKTAVMKYSVPVPPIPIQHEIVRILDSFTELIAKLTSELTARKMQYEYYRDLLLTFPKPNEIILTDRQTDRQTDETVRWIKIHEMIQIKRGIRVVRKQLQEKGKYAVYQNSLVPLGYYDNNNRSANTVFVIGAGAAGEIGFSYVDFWAADDCFCFECTENINSRFLYYVLMKNKEQIAKKVRRSSVPRLSREVLENLKIPVPCIEEQNRIVSILDRFNSLCSDIVTGLPAEITARQKQYEYYRDKLLTFKSEIALNKPIN